MAVEIFIIFQAFLGIRSFPKMLVPFSVGSFCVHHGTPVLLIQLLLDGGTQPTVT